MKQTQVVLFLLLLALQIQARQVIDLSGSWLSTQAEAPTVSTKWTYQPYSSFYEKDARFEPFRTEGSPVLNPYIMTPTQLFVGEEDYVREFEVPAEWEHQQVTLFLERVHIKSRVFINGVEASSLYVCPEMGKGCRSLGAPHQYDVTGLLKPGQTNRLLVKVSNTMDQVPMSKNSYSVSDNCQGNWNGVVGTIRFVAQPAIRLQYTDTRIFPDVAAQEARVQVMLRYGTQYKKGKPLPAKPQKLTLRFRSEAGEKTFPVLLEADSLRFEAQLSGFTRTWDEYQPSLYHLQISLLDRKGKELDTQNLTFGMRQVSADTHYIRINGRPVFLRGNVDGAQFPLTGYPPTDVPYWMGYFRTLREWGFNMVRFHSWCPPEAAFVAADSLGFYLQPECSSWPSHNVMLRTGNDVERYIEQEAEQIIQAYGNHPSFVMLAGGNEPKGKDWLPMAERWTTYWAKQDPRRLYTGFATGGSWAWAKGNQYHMRAGLRGLDWSRRRPESMSDFNAAIDTLSQPFVAHEVGQWCAFPNFREIPKFTGLMQPSFHLIARHLVQQAGMEQLADSFVLASGRLQVLCYKHELERLRRTRNYGGYALLSIADYLGQGTATEGMLDVFYEPKPYVKADEWLQWGGPVVPLLRTRKFTYLSSDTLRFGLEVSNLGEGPLTHTVASWTLTDAAGRIYASRTYAPQDFPFGSGNTIADESLPLSQLGLTEATQLEFSLQVGKYRNTWNFWVYPSEPDLDAGEVYVTRVPDPKAQQILEKGGKVLLIGYDQINNGRGIRQSLLPVFWNPLWMGEYSTQTYGLFIRSESPMFRHFPTSFHSDLQWWEVVNRTYPVLLDDMPADLQPLVQAIGYALADTRMGVIFEAKVGRGKLVLVNADLINHLDRRIAARQLRSSILQYMNSDDFQPATSVTWEQIYSLFTKFRQAL
jgi:hypothetical protein